MSMTHDQVESCSQETMGAQDSNKEASKGRKSEKQPFLSTKYKQMYAYFITALRNCSEETRDEFTDSLKDLDLENVDVEKECRKLDNISDE